MNSGTKDKIAMWATIIAIVLLVLKAMGVI